MARPKQDGLLYFSFDTDFFYADKRIRRLLFKYKGKGVLIYIYLLSEIYRNGYYISLDEELIEDIAAYFQLKEGFIEQVLTYLFNRSLLTKSILATQDTIITSPGIQKRYQEAKKSSKRQIEVDSEIWLLGESETASCIKVVHNVSNSEKNPSNSEKNSIKESKVNKSKVKQREPLRHIEEFISAYPKECNRYLTETAYIDLVVGEVETEENLVQCAKNYAEACKILETTERYIKNAENFLKDFVFEKYLPEKYKKPEQKKPKNSFHNFQQNDYDYDDLLQKVKVN